MNLLLALTIACALGSGLVAGVFFTFSNFVMPGLAKLPPEEGVAAMQAINVAAINRWFMGLLFGTAALCLVVLVASWSSRAETTGKLRIAGAALYVISAIAITIAFNVPENERLARIAPASAVAGEAWRGFLSTWCAFNHARAAGSLGAALLLLLAMFGLTGCRVDLVRPLPPPGSSRPAANLSELGLFEGDVAAQAPAAGVARYEVNASLFADGAEKRRFLYLPKGAALREMADRWELPEGAYVVKTFSFPRDARSPERGERLVETRILMQTARGLVASTYVWTADQRDAIASSGDVDVPVTWIDASGAAREQRYHVPGTSTCDGCHAGRTLGLTARQLGHGASAGDRLVDPFGPGSLDARGRSYLDANCSHCHGAGGAAADTGLLLDLRHTEAARLPCGTILGRLTSPLSFLRMPRGPSREIDQRGVELLRTWFATAKPCAA